MDRRKQNSCQINAIKREDAKAARQTDPDNVVDVTQGQVVFVAVDPKGKPIPVHTLN